MTDRSISQEKDTLGNTIIEELILLKRIYKKSQVGIAKELGYSDDIFSQIKGGFAKGSPQLLSGLSLLRKVIELQNAPPPETVEQKLARLEFSVREIEKKVGVSYPTVLSRAFEMNEGPASENQPKLPPETENLLAKRLKGLPLTEPQKEQVRELILDVMRSAWAPGGGPAKSVQQS